MELQPDDKLLLQRAYMKAAAAQEVLSFLSEHFQQKYQLPNGSQVTPDGRIITPTPLDGATDLSSLIGQS